MKTFTRVTAALAAVMAVSSFAQTADIEQAWLDPAGRGSLLVGNGNTLQHLEFRVGVGGYYTYGNLRPTQDTTRFLVRDRLGLQLFGALGLFDWLELGVNVPVYLLQQGSPALGLSSTGLGNPFVQAKVNILDESKPVMLGVALGVGLPIGTQAAQGNGGIELAPKVQVGKVFAEWQLGAELGFLYRPATDYSALANNGDAVGSQLWLAATATTVNTTGPRGEFTLRGVVPVGGGRPGIEGQVGVRWPVGPVELFGSAGPGFAGEPSTPLLRAYLGIAFANTPMTQPACVEGREYDVAACPDLDKDGDGVRNGVDGAPLDAEDKDDFEDQDGVPDLDNDKDGVPDASDKCRDQAGPKENGGCPDTDQDGDGIVDRLDRCPTEKEDADGFEDADGCPDLDNDQDGIADAKDACPLEAGIPQEKGCPAKDTDQDGVADFEDNCPTEAGVKENAGCPAAKKQLVVITGTSLKILDKVYFNTGKATIQARSNALLDNVAQVLLSHEGIKLVQVEGHTDNTGNAEKNKALSQARADAVKAYLVKKGVAEARLKPVGFGQERPAESNDTPAGRDANRRVEFNIVEQ